MYSYRGSSPLFILFKLVNHSLIYRLVLSCLLVAGLSFPLLSSAEEDDTSEKIEAAADKIKELIEAYQKAEVNFVKREIVTIKDTAGNPQSCDVAIFYDNGQQARFHVSDGSFEGNFDHGANVPANALSLRLSNCACRPIKTDHVSTWLGIVDEVEKVKKVIVDEIRGMAEDKAKEYAEELFNKVAEKAGLAAGASGFLTGFKAGAELGAAVGDHITEEINKILDSARKRNQRAAKDLDDSPLYPNVGHVNPRGRLGNAFGDSPQLQNQWDITVRCGSRTIPPAEAGWNRVPGLIAAGRPPQETTSSPSAEEAAATRQAAREKAEQEQREREAEAQRERERREAEAEDARRRAEAKRRYEQKQQRLKAQAREISTTCKICDPIRAQIAATEKKITEVETEIPVLEQAVTDAETSLDKARNKEQQARDKLDNFQNPDSSVTDIESGRTITSTDLEVRNQAAIEAMDRYRAGEITAAETENAWKNLDDPQQIKALKQKAKQRLESEIEAAKQNREQKEATLKTAKQAAGKAKRQLKGLQDQLQDLQTKLEQCIKQCQAQAMDIARGRVSDLEGLMGYSVAPLSSQTTGRQDEDDKDSETEAGDPDVDEGKSDDDDKSDDKQPVKPSPPASGASGNPPGGSGGSQGGGDSGSDKSDVDTGKNGDSGQNDTGSSEDSSEALVCPVDSVSSNLRPLTTLCSPCRSIANEINRSIEVIKELETKLNEAISDYNSLCGETDGDDPRDVPPPDCNDGKKISLGMAYTGEGNTSVSFRERLRFGVGNAADTETYSDFDDLLNTIRGKLRTPIDKKGVCRDCVKELYMLQHGGIEDKLAGTYQFGELIISRSDVDRKTGKLKTKPKRIRMPMLRKLEKLRGYLCEDGKIVFVQCNIGRGERGSITGQAVSNFFGANVMSPTISAEAGSCPTSADVISGDWKEFEPKGEPQNLDEDRDATKQDIDKQKREARKQRVLRLQAQYERLKNFLAKQRAELSNCEKQCKTEKPSELGRLFGDIFSEVEIIDVKNVSGNNSFDARDPLAPEASKIGFDSVDQETGGGDTTGGGTAGGGTTGGGTTGGGTTGGGTTGGGTTGGGTTGGGTTGGGTTGGGTTGGGTTGGGTTGGGTTGGGTTGGGTNIDVLPVGGTYVPFDNLTLAGPDACSSNHYHGGPVIACDGSTQNDPAPGVCGFGTINDVTSIPDSSCTDPNAGMVTGGGGAVNLYTPLVGSYSGNGGCGINSTSLAIVGSDNATLNLPPNGTVDFLIDPAFDTANSVNTNLTLFGNPGHSCQIFNVNFGTPEFELFCENSGGGTCFESFVP